MNPSEFDFLTVREAAASLRCSTRTIREKVHGGVLGQCVRNGKFILIPKEGLRAYIGHRLIP